jgi:hypothetical protein
MYNTENDSLEGNICDICAPPAFELSAARLGSAFLRPEAADD